MFQQNDHAVR